MPAYKQFLNKAHLPQTREARKAAPTTMATVDDQFAVPDDFTQRQLPKIKIPRWAWNSFEPQHHLSTRRATRSTASSQMRITPKTFTVHEDRHKITQSTSDTLVHEEESITPPTQQRSCKTRLWAFHHGGPKRGLRGAMQNEITYESPCLQYKCANCWKWQAHLMCGQYLAGELPGEDATKVDKVDIEPLSPKIDPHILNGTWQNYTWQNYTSRRSSTKSTASLALPDPNASPILTPIKSSFAYDTLYPELSLSFNHGIDITPPDQQYTVFLQASLADQTVSTAPPETEWCCTPRQRHTVRLCFSSHVGKQKFRELVIKREKKAKKASYDRARRVRLQMMKRQMAANHR
jgi:hypothetical protein